MLLKAPVPEERLVEVSDWRDVAPELTVSPEPNVVAPETERVLTLAPEDVKDPDTFRVLEIFTGLLNV